MPNRVKPEESFPFRVGDVYVATMPNLREVEVEDVLPHAQLVKVKGEGWLERSSFESVVKGRLGRAVYSAGLLSPRRRMIRDIASIALPAPKKPRAGHAKDRT